MQRSVCCNEPVVGKMVSDDDYIDYCPLCEHCCEGDTYDDESPEDVAKQFNLEYLDTSEHPFGGNDIHWFNDLTTGSTLISDNLSDLELKVEESRKKFNK